MVCEQVLMFFSCVCGFQCGDARLIRSYNNVSTGHNVSGLKCYVRDGRNGFT